MNAHATGLYNMRCVEQRLLVKPADLAATDPTVVKKLYTILRDEGGIPDEGQGVSDDDLLAVAAYFNRVVDDDANKAMIHIIGNLHAVSENESAAYIPMTDHALDSLNGHSLQDNFERLLFFKVGRLYDLGFGFADNLTQTKALWKAYVAANDIFVTLDETGSELLAAEEKSRRKMEATLLDSLKAGLETAEPDTIFAATCLAALIPDDFPTASAMVQALTDHLKALFGVTLSFNEGNATTVLADNFFRQGKVSPNCKPFTDPDSFVHFMCVRYMMRAKTDFEKAGNLGGTGIHPWSADFKKAQLMPDCFCVLSQGHNKPSCIVQLLEHWGIYYLEGEPYSDLEARLYYFMTSNSCHHGKIKAACSTALEKRRDAAAMSAADFARYFTLAKAATGRLPPAASTLGPAPSPFHDALVKPVAVTNTLVRGLSLGSLTHANARTWIGAFLLNALLAIGRVDGISYNNTTAVLAFVCSFAGQKITLTPTEVLAAHSAYLTAKSEQDGSLKLPMSAVFGSVPDLSRGMHTHRDDGLPSAMRVDSLAAQAGVCVPGSTSFDDSAIANQLQRPPDDRSAEMAQATCNALQAVTSAVCESGTSEKSPATAAAYAKHPQVLTMTQNTVLLMKDQTKEQSIFAQTKSYIFIMRHMYDSANIELLQFKRSPTAKCLPFTNDESGFMRLYEAVKLFGKVHITKTTRQAEGFIWLLKVLDERSPVTSNGTDVIDLVNLVKVLFAEYEKAMIRAPALSYDPTAYPTLKSLASVPVKKALARLDTGKAGRELIAETMNQIAIGSSVTTNDTINQALTANFKFGGGQSGGGGKKKRPAGDGAAANDLSPTRAKSKSGSKKVIKKEKPAKKDKLAKFENWKKYEGFDKDGDPCCRNWTIFVNGSRKPCAEKNMVNGVCKFSHKPPDRDVSIAKY
jgi:hypothetical protein